MTNCLLCGSEFDLQKHHHTQRYKNHQQQIKEKLPYIWLCRTCHYLEHHNDYLQQNEKFQRRIYNNHQQKINKQYEQLQTIRN